MCYLVKGGICHHMHGKSYWLGSKQVYFVCILLCKTFRKENLDIDNILFDIWINSSIFYLWICCSALLFIDFNLLFYPISVFTSGITITRIPSSSSWCSFLICCTSEGLLLCGVSFYCFSSFRKSVALPPRLTVKQLATYILKIFLYSPPDGRESVTVYPTSVDWRAVVREYLFTNYCRTITKTKLVCPYQWSLWSQTEPCPALNLDLKQAQDG